MSSDGDGNALGIRQPIYLHSLLFEFNILMIMHNMKNANPVQLFNNAPNPLEAKALNPLEAKASVYLSLT